jgi:hypothetical protein
MSKQFFRNFKELPQGIVIELIASTIATVIILFITFISKNILIQKVPELKEYENWLYVIWALILIWVLLRLYLKVNKLRAYLPELNPNFNVIEKHIFHHYKAIDAVVHKRTFKILCMKDEIRTYSDKFIWTGEKYSVRCLNKDFTLVLTDKIGHYDTYEIRFDRLLKKGDVVEFTVEWDCENRTNNARPYFSTTITAPTEKLVMDLLIDPSLGVTTASLDTSYDEGEPPRETETKQLVSGHTTFNIDKPNLYFHYKVRWLF